MQHKNRTKNIFKNQKHSKIQKHKNMFLLYFYKKKPKNVFFTSMGQLRLAITLLVSVMSTSKSWDVPGKQAHCAMY